jgi:hypothetical protein
MRSDILFPDAPGLLVEGGRRYVSVPWDHADAVRAALHKRGCPTTLCLNPETRQARLELWPGVAPEAVLAVLEARQSSQPTASGALPSARKWASGPKTTESAELVCI